MVILISVVKKFPTVKILCCYICFLDYFLEIRNLFCFQLHPRMKTMQDSKTNLFLIFKCLSPFFLKVFLLKLLG